MPKKTDYLRKPEWLKISLNTNSNYRDIKSKINNKSLNTVCEEARCPNIHECWGLRKTATFMILGDTCTRNCRFCSVKTGTPSPIDYDEPDNVAETIKELKLNHVVITMVTRDDLYDAGASILKETVLSIKKKSPDCRVEVLSSDLSGIMENIEILVSAEPYILGHNIETVKRLSNSIRSNADYGRSLSFFKTVKFINPELLTKSSIMIGLGESIDEIIETMIDLKNSGVEILNIGQYLQPSRNNIPVLKYREPDEFDFLKKKAYEIGFRHCESGPLVRSSYMASDITL